MFMRHAAQNKGRACGFTLWGKQGTLSGSAHIGQDSFDSSQMIRMVNSSDDTIGRPSYPVAPNQVILCQSLGAEYLMDGGHCTMSKSLIHLTMLVD